MAKSLRRIWKYVGTAIGMKFDELADPKVQLTQAIEEAQDQHRKLKAQAANVIANQKQTELRLNRAIGELEKTTQSARQAVLLADQAQQGGDQAQALEYTHVAETLATRMVTIEQEVDSLKELHYQTTQAAGQAKSAVQQNAFALQRKLSERQKLLSQLDQAKMQEQLNKAMGQLSESVGQDVPSLEQVRAKIEERYARALATAELSDQGAELKMLEAERAVIDTEAKARLDSLRSQLGLPIGGNSSAAGRGALPTSHITGALGTGTTGGADADITTNSEANADAKKSAD